MERAFWVVVVLIGLLIGLLMVSAALKNWSDNPEKVAIKTFSQPAREVPYPAITICNSNGYDVGEYIRAIFDNFEFSWGRSTKMQKLAKTAKTQKRKNKNGKNAKTCRKCKKLGNRSFLPAAEHAGL